MSKIKPNRAFAAEHVNAFGGLGQSLLAADQSATHIENFRISNDGSLKKRTGYRIVRQFPYTVRAYWEGSIKSYPYIFAVAEDKIYHIDAFSGVPELIGTLGSSSGRIDFFLYEDDLYITDDDGLRVYNPATHTFPAAEPYVPLYGKGWDPVACGSLFEPFNLLTNRIRIHYANTTNQTIFRLPFFAQSIDGLYVNGKKITNYSFTAQSNIFTIHEGYTGFDVEVGITVMLDVDTKGIQTSKKAIVYPGSHHSTLCLYDGDYGYRIYCSSYVPSSSLSASRAIYPNGKKLYFKDENILLAGDTQYAIHSICQFGNRLLAYSAVGSWQITCPDDAQDTPSISVLLPTTGCTAPYSAIVCDGKPVIVNKKGVFMINIPASDSKPPELTCISNEISEHLTHSLLENCIAREDPIHNELWIRDPNDLYARIFVYNLTRKQWYIFTNFDATLFFDLPSFRGFSSANKLYALDEDLYTDNGEEITSVYQSGYFDFSHPEAKKRSLRMTVCKKTGSDPAFLKLDTEHAERTFELVGTEGDVPEVFDSRALMGRFRFLRFRILVSGKNDCRIYSLSFYANL